MVPEQVLPRRTLPRRRAALVLLLAGSVLLSACSVISSLQADPTGPGGGQFIIQCETPIRSAPDDPIVYPRVPAPPTTTSSTAPWGSTRSAPPPMSPADRLLTGRLRWRSRRHGRLLAPDALHRWPARPGDEVDLLLQHGGEGRPRPGVPARAKGHRRRHDGDGAAGRQDRLLGLRQRQLDLEGREPPAVPERRRRALAARHLPRLLERRDLDSLDHKSHMAYSQRGDDDDKHCPSSHPVPLPELTMRYRVGRPAPDPSSLTPASGRWTRCTPTSGTRGTRRGSSSWCPSA